MNYEFLKDVKWNIATHTTEQAKEPFWVWLSLMRKVPSLFPFNSSSASFRLIPPTYQLLSSWWVTSARVYGLRNDMEVEELD